MNLNRNLLFIIFICLLPFLSGCAAVAFGGAVGGATVAASSAIDRRTTGTQIEDETIEVKAILAINKDAELKEQAHLNITSYNTVVLVTGEAPTEAMRQRAVDIVRSVNKVSHVYNEISIAAPSSMMARSSDSLTTSKVKARMIADRKLHSLYVKIVTEKGVVYLMGLVTRQESELAANIARQTGGVQKVVKLFQYID